MVGIAVLGYVAVTIAVVLTARISVRRRSPDVQRGQLDGPVVRAMRAARRRSLLAIGFAVTLMLVGVFLAQQIPEWRGISAAVAPAVGGSGGLLLYAATPPLLERAADNSQQSATLEPRQPWTFVSRKMLALLLASTSVLLVLLAFTGLTSSADDSGQYRAISFATGAMSSTAGPYPGWFYALPLMASTVVLTASTLLALRRIAVTPSLPGTGLEHEDRHWRSTSTRVITGLAVGAMTAQLGGVALVAGNAMGNAYFLGTPIMWQVVADGLFVLGLLASVGSVISVALAASRAFALPMEISGGAGRETSGSLQPPVAGTSG